MGIDPIDRRSFLGMGGMAFICTLAGQQVATDQGQIDVYVRKAGAPEHE